MTDVHVEGAQNWWMLTLSHSHCSSLLDPAAAATQGTHIGHYTFWENKAQTEEQLSIVTHGAAQEAP